MQIYDTVKEMWVEDECTRESLTKIMIEGRQIDLYFDHVKNDADGYIFWDVEHWSSVTDNNFIRTYTLNGKHSLEYNGYNVWDLRYEFHPEDAVKITIS